MSSRVAALLSIGALLWCVMLIWAPWSVAGHRSATSLAAVLVYEAGRLVCHQKPERSFHLAGVQLPVCARCTGLYFSAAIGALVAWRVPRQRRRPGRRERMALVVAALPTLVTVAVELAGVAHPSNLVRALCAVPIGVAAGWVCVRLLLSDRAGRAVSHGAQERTPAL